MEALQSFALRKGAGTEEVAQHCFSCASDAASPQRRTGTEEVAQSSRASVGVRRRSEMTAYSECAVSDVTCARPEVMSYIRAHSHMNQPQPV